MSENKDGYPKNTNINTVTMFMGIINPIVTDIKL